MRPDRLISLNIVQPWRRIFSNGDHSTKTPKHRNTETQPSRTTVPPLHRSTEAPSFPVPILMYHSIADDTEPGVAPYYQVNTTPAAFRQQMQLLADHGYRAIPLSDLVSALARQNGATTAEPLKSEISNFKSAQPPVPGSDSQVSGFSPQVSVRDSQPSTLNHKLAVITFDDGFRSFYTHAFPVLQEFGFTATVFLPTAFISDTPRVFSPAGSPKHRNTETSAHRNTVCLTWSEVRELHTAGISFGSHTVTHPKLVDLSWEQIRIELSDSKREIEHRLQASCTHFCYPYAFPQAKAGFCTGFCEALQETGYNCCTTTEVGRVRQDDSQFRLKRLPVNSMDDPKLLDAKLSGAYDWIATPQSLVKRMKALRSHWATEAPKR